MSDIGGLMKFWMLCGAILLCMALAASSTARTRGQPTGLTDRDRQAVIAVTQAYREAWLANDSARVMETLSADDVLVPGGMAPIAGERAIHDFWFPASGPSTMVTAMEQNVTDVVGGGDRAVVSGRGVLTFHLGRADESRTQYSWFANVLARQADGRWLIVRRMWVDFPK